MFPPYILAQLYVKGSLKNTPEGFEFSLKNLIESTLLVGIGPFVAGGLTYEASAITLHVGESTYKGEEISRQKPVPARVGIPMVLRVAGQSLAPGAQTIFVSADSSDIGKVKFDIKDTLR
jgi:hydroxymethylglutaryl-CoA reductase (NADPH)